MRQRVLSVTAGASFGIALALRWASRIPVFLETSETAEPWVVTSIPPLGWVLAATLIGAAIGVFLPRRARTPCWFAGAAAAAIFVPKVFEIAPFVAALSGRFLDFVLVGCGLTVVSCLLSPSSPSEPLVVLRGLTANRVSVLAACIFLAVGFKMSNDVGLSGDEPHYLLITHSIVHDGDLQVENNYLDKDFARRGVLIHEKTSVERVARDGDGFALHTSSGVLRAKEVLIATNGYTDRLVPSLAPRVFPVGSYIIVTERLPLELQKELSPKGRMFYDSKNFLNYFRLTPDGRMLWGGRNDLSTDLDLQESASRLKAQLVHTFPQLEDIPLTHTWTGKLGITFDLMPHIGGESRVLVVGAYDARYVPTGHLVYWKDGGLFAVPFDADRAEVTGGPVSLVENVQADSFVGAAQFDVSDSGTLVYLSSVGDERRSVVWVERSGREEALGVPPDAYTYPRLSPDGGTVAFEVRAEDGDLWLWSVERESMTRFTVDPAADLYPTWTPDGQTLLFASTRSGPFMMYSRSAIGTRDVVSVGDQPMRLPVAVTPDGLSLLFREVLNPDSVLQSDIGILRLDDPADSRLLLDSKFDERNAALSPDGRWLAYESNASGRYEIYVHPFPDIEEGRWQVSTRGGERPLWAYDGRELFYVEDGKVMAVAIETAPTFSMGETTVAVAGDYYMGDQLVVARTYDVSRDGQRFLMIKEDPRGRAAASQIQVVFNWFNELERLVPVE